MLRQPRRARGTRRRYSRMTDVGSELPSSGTAAFIGAEDFAAALREGGAISFVVTGEGRFAAQLTRVALSLFTLSAGYERLSRTAFIKVPAESVLLSFPLDDESRLFWGGVRLNASEIASLGPGGSVHVRTEGPCRWGSIQLATDEFAKYARAIANVAPAIPCPPMRWRASSATRRLLRGIHAAAIRTAEARPRRLTEPEVVHGLEQQVTELLVKFLTAGRAKSTGASQRKQRALAIHFENSLGSDASDGETVADICAALGVGRSTLQRCCAAQLGVGPARYLRFRRSRGERSVCPVAHPTPPFEREKP